MVGSIAFGPVVKNYRAAKGKVGERGLSSKTTFNDMPMVTLLPPTRPHHLKVSLPPKKTKLGPGLYFMGLWGTFQIQMSIFPGFGPSVLFLYGRTKVGVSE